MTFRQTGGVVLPTGAEVEQWSNLSQSPLLQMNVSAVPTPNFVQMQNETYLGHVMFKESINGLSANHNISHINKIALRISQGQSLINEMYVQRGVCTTLQRIAEEQSSVPQATINAAMPLYDKIVGFAQRQMSYCDESVQDIVRLFNFDTWAKGAYSDELIDRVCECYFTMSTLDEMRAIKTSVTNDFSFLRKRVGRTENSEEERKFGQFFADGNYCQVNLIKQMRDQMAPAAIQLVSAIITTRIRNAIDNHDYLRPEMFNVFVRTLMLFTKINEGDLDLCSYAQRIGESHTILPLAYEVSYNMEYAVEKLPRDKKQKGGRKGPAERDEIERLTKEMSVLSNQIHDAKAGKVSPEDFYKFIVKVIKEVGDVKNYLREQLAMKLAKPPMPKEKEPEMCSFERSLRNGYSEQEIYQLLRVLMVWRTITDTLKNSTDFILQKICPYFYQVFQRFVKDKCEQINKGVKKKVANQMKEIMMPLQEVLGDWDEGEERTRPKPTKRTLKQSQGSPSPSSIEFLRIQLQHISKPKSVPIKMKCIDKASQDDIKAFLAETSLWAEFLNLGAIIEDIADQSDLFFKEVQMDMNKEDLAKQKMSNFPVRSSLPFILGEFALKNFFLPELTELIFYPLGIYDDAAHIAQFKLKSRFLLEEIKAEAKTCVQTLSIMISEYTFGSFRAYASIRFLPDTVYGAMKGQLLNSDEWVDSAAYRLGVLLHQNQFYLHCQQIDIKGMIFQNIEEQVRSGIMKLTKLPQTAGISTLVAVSKGFDIIREAHRLLTEQGFALLPFDMLLKTYMGSASPDSFLSPFVQDIITNATHRVTKNWYFRSNPLRLVPINPRTLSAHVFGKGAVGKLLSAVMDPVANIITVEHFCCLTRLVDDGCLVCGQNLLVEDFGKLFERFVEMYTPLHDKDYLRRIADPPLATAGKLVFDRFEGAYMFLSASDKVNELFGAMARIGNLLAMANMFDVAMNCKKMTRSHIIGYLKGIDLELGFHQQLEAVVGKQIAEVIEREDPVPTNKEVYPYVLSRCLSKVIESVTKTHKDIFEEKTSTILDLTSLTGFGSSWSVLEYVFVMMEAFRDNQKPENPSPFEIFGEGVMLCAAAIILALNHERVCFATNIGRRLQRVGAVDYSAQCDDRIQQFCVREKFESSCLKCALSTYRPIIGHLKATGLLL